VPGHHIDLIDLDGTVEDHSGRLGHQAGAQLLGHGVHVIFVEVHLLRNQPHEGQAQHPNPQRLVVPGQHRAGEIIEAQVLPR